MCEKKYFCYFSQNNYEKYSFANTLWIYHTMQQLQQHLLQLYILNKEKQELNINRLLFTYSIYNIVIISSSINLELYF